MLDLVLEAPDPHVDARDAHRYVLYEDQGQYRLPDAVLLTAEGTATVPVQEARISDVVGGDRGALPLQGAIRSAWDVRDQPGLGVIAARCVLAEGRKVPANLVEAARAEPGRPVEVLVTWRYSYTEVSGVHATGHRTVRLVFAPAGQQPPSSRPRLDAVAERMGLPAPIRSIGSRKHFPYFAAVDFGASSSTVTVYDARERILYRMDPGQAQRLRAEFAVLLAATPPDYLSAEWAKVTAGILDQAEQAQPGLRAAAGLDALCARLRSAAPGGPSDPLLDAVAFAFEDELAEAVRDLSHWLAPRLLRCYDEAFAVPPLQTLNLRPVPLDPIHNSFEIPTVATITNAAPVAIEFGATGPDVVLNLKAKLPEAEPLGAGREGVDGADATTDDLIALVYRELIERTEQFLQDSPEEEPEALAELVVMFPTTTPPATRLHLQRMMSFTLDVVAPSFVDEGMAVALYFLMRDFGGIRPEFGAEALRARSRQVSTSPPSWRHNMLVIDIGAGTTDIALVRLTLQDITEPVEGVDQAVQGRYYVIRPEVINSTGHPQLGGNYLTLRVFYWIKAAIADALLDGPGQETQRRDQVNRVKLELGLDDDAAVPKLAPLVAHSGIETPVPPHIVSALRALLPTHREPGAPSEKAQAFMLLWGIAEVTKIALGGDLPDPDHGYLIDRDRIVSVLNAIDVATSKTLEPLIPDEGVWLSPEEFRVLARPVIAYAAELGQWLVEQSLRGKPGERLDRVLLSGKSSMMEMTRRVIAEEFGGGDPEGRVPWNSAAIAVELNYAKQAASIGTAWARLNSGYATDPTGERDQLRRGRSVLFIDVSNVFQTLPCEFVLLRSGGQTSPLLLAGTPLVEVDQSGRLAARQEWTEDRPWPALLPAFEVHRPIRPGMTQVWGTYHFQRDAMDEPDFMPDPRIWLTSAAGSGARIRAQLEVDEKLVPTLNLSQGRPHYLTAPAAAWDLHAELPSQCWSSHESRLRTLPASLILVGAPGELYPDGEAELFPPWLPGPEDLVSGYFPEYFHEHAGLDSVAIPGRIAARLPSRPAGGNYRLLLRKPGGPDKQLDVVLSAVARNERIARYTATLDVRGRLTVHCGYPPYWRAGMLRDVETHPGAVLRREMRPGKTVLDPAWDPFTGRH